MIDGERVLKRKETAVKRFETENKSSFVYKYNMQQLILKTKVISRCRREKDNVSAFVSNISG